MTVSVTTWRSRYAEDVGAEEFVNWRWPDMKATGVVLSWDVERGFGFIKPDRSGPDAFAHVRALTNAELLMPGQRVEYQPVFDRERRKFKARDVRVIS